MSTIKILLGEKQIGNYRVEKESVILGRAPEVDICIPNLAVSRKHGRIFKKNDRWFYEDLCSTNGTYMGSSKITLCQVMSGTELIIGKCRIIFSESNQKQDDSHPPYSIDWRKILNEEEGEGDIKVKIDETIKFDKTVIIKSKPRLNDHKKQENIKPIAYIEFVDRKEKINISEQVIYIGKDPDCKIRINGLMIGPKHARIEFNDECIKIIALKSFPSVCVNGQKITERILKKDDYIDIGSYRLRIRFF